MSGRVLVTGAGGFIGSHLTAALAAAGRTVVALDLEPVRGLGSNVEPLQGDVADPETRARALAGVRTVFHLAAAHLGAGTPASEYDRVNVDAVRGLALGALEAGVRRFVHCSSVGVYGPLVRVPADEETACRPELDYEKTKLEGEGVIRELVRERDLPAVILRPVWVYGPGCPRTEKLMRSVSRGRFVVGGRGDRMRHCIYIRDMVRAFLLAEVAEQASGRTLIIGNDGAVTVRRLIDEIVGITGGRRPPSIPLPMLRAVATAAEWIFLPLGREPPLSRRTLRFFEGNSSFDVSRARSVLGFEAAHDLASGLADTWRRIRDRQPWHVSVADYEELQRDRMAAPRHGSVR
jgi:nucleoside-diphosphate-sugar epimerase